MISVKSPLKEAHSQVALPRFQYRTLRFSMELDEVQWWQQNRPNSTFASEFSDRLPNEGEQDGGTVHMNDLIQFRLDGDFRKQEYPNQKNADLERKSRFSDINSKGHRQGGFLQIPPDLDPLFDLQRLV